MKYSLEVKDSESRIFLEVEDSSIDNRYMKQYLLSILGMGFWPIEWTKISDGIEEGVVCETTKKLQYKARI